MAKNRIMNLDKEYVNYQLSVKTMLKQVALKARVSLRSIIDFSADQGQPFKDTIIRSSVSNKRITILHKFSQPEMKSTFYNMAQNKTALRANIIDFRLEKKFDQSEDSINMSPAQIVFAVIYKQQVEWMKETEQKPE